MTITEIVPQKGGKFLIYLNGEAALLLYKSEIEKVCLKEGEELPDETYGIIIDLLTRRAKSRTLHLLDKKDLTETQLRNKLKEGYYPEEAIDTAVQAAKAGNYLNDRRFAFQYVMDKKKRKSRKQIEIDLKSKGLSDDLIEEALCELESEDEQQLIKKLIQKKCPENKELDFNEKQKLIRYLAGKGFPISEIMQALE